MILLQAWIGLQIELKKKGFFIILNNWLISFTWYLLKEFLAGLLLAPVLSYLDLAAILVIDIYYYTIFILYFVVAP